MDKKVSVSSQSFGVMLRRLRKHAHLTQAELAGLVGYSTAQINRLETGARAPDPDVVMMRFVPALGMRPDANQAIQLVDLARQASSRRIPSTATNGFHSKQGLPAPATPLLGRGADLQLLESQLSNDAVRVLTLVGPPGVGKTRLAIQLAKQIEAQHQQETLFVPLAAVTDGDLIADAMLQAMGITSNAQDPLAQVKQVLLKKRMLLVLDNLEQLLEVARAEVTTSIISEIVASAPNVKVLATSRFSLRLNGEHLFEVPVLAPAPAKALFMQRVKAQNPLFRPNPQEDGIIDEICRRLDYLPLAIELAAARIRLFEPAALLKRLDGTLSLLTAGMQDVPPRHRTLRNAIEWSFNLLAPGEQMLFRRLGVFADGCTLPMLEAIAGDDLPGSIIDLTQSLVDKSMLKAEIVNGVTRFKLLEMLREYAVEMLTRSGESVAISKRSAQWFADQVHEMQSSPATGQSAVWFDWFDAEINNLRAVIQWSMQDNQIKVGLRLAADLGITWRMHGPVRDGYKLISQVLTHPHARDEALLYAEALISGAHLAEEIGESTLAENWLSEALDISRRFGDEHLAGWALSYLGHRATTRANYAKARLLIGESIRIFSKEGRCFGLAMALLWQGTVERDQGNFEQGLEHYEEVASIAHDIQSSILSFLSAGWASFIHFNLGENDRAEALALQALEVTRANKIGTGTMLMISHLGAIALSRGDIDDAIEKLEYAREALESHGNPNIRASALIHLSLARHLKGESEHGRQLVCEAIQTHWRCGHLYQLAAGLLHLAWITADQNHYPRAVRLMGAADAINTRLDKSSPRYYQKYHQLRLERARAELGLVDFDLYWCEGQAMNDQTAVAYALNGV